MALYMKHAHLWRDPDDDSCGKTSKVGPRENSSSRLDQGGTSTRSRNERKPRCKTCFDLDPNNVSEDWERVVEHLEHQRNVLHSEIRKSSASGCRFCSLICEAIRQHLCSSEEALNSDAPLAVSFHRRGLVFLSDFTAEARIRNIVLYAPLGSPPAWDTLCSLREISSNAASKECLSLTKRWVSDCVNFHEHCNRNSQSKLPKRVIDVGTDETGIKLLEGEEMDGRYAALSHRWGNSQPIDTKVSTLNLRKQSLQWTSLPATFQDAIIIIRELGLRYLWIDSLCIIQDDKRDWEMESAKMGSIYEGAHIVIAASGSLGPQHSFLGPRPTAVSNPPELNYHRQDGAQCIVKARPVLSWAESTEPLDERAWVFQEHRRAVRLLRYTTNELIWHCRTKSSCECDSAHFQDVIDPGMLSIEYCARNDDSSPRAVFSNWQRMVGEYTPRLLTRAMDRLPAVAGLAAYVHETTASDYLAGLWRDNLIFDLQWQTAKSIKVEVSPSIDLTQRYIWQFRHFRSIPKYRAPTFSWASIDFATEYSVPSRRRKNCRIDAVVLEAQSTLKGRNLFGEVTDGFITLEAPIVEADVFFTDHHDDRSTLGRPGIYDLNRNGMTMDMYADLPMVETLATVSSGEQIRTMKRASIDDAVRPVAGPVFCLALCQSEGVPVSIVLGWSPRVPGAYERLGIMEMSRVHRSGNYQDIVPSQAWFANAKRAKVKIV